MRLPNPGHDAIAHEADAYDAYRYFQAKGSDTPFNTLTQFVGLGQNNEAGKAGDEGSAGKLWERALGAGGYATLRRHWATARARWEASAAEGEGGRGKREWEQPLLPLVAPLPGYARTAHARRARARAYPPSGTGTTAAGAAGAGGARGWEPFTPADCAEPGHVLPSKADGE